MALDPTVFVHPKALVESDTIGPNTRIWGFAQVMKGAIIGAHCNICAFSFIEDGAEIGNGVKIKNGVHVWDKVRIEDDVFVGPAVVFTNEKYPRAFQKSDRSQWLATTVRRGATLGAGSVIVCGSEIGEYAFVAAGAVVTRNVPAHAMVKGNPGRVVGWVCRCLKTRIRLDHRAEGLSCNACETFLSNLPL